MTVHSQHHLRLDLDAVRLDLEIAETTRSRQLAQLPVAPGDAVAALHRSSGRRLLLDIRQAIERIDDGRYGVCAGCRELIAPQRLELRPWTATCVRCAGR